MTAGSLDQAESPCSALERRRAMLKLDLTILPIMTLYCLFSFMDRSSIANARIAGLQDDLGLTDHQYKICVSILNVAHMISALPSNLLLRKIGPHILLPAFVTSWGVVVTAQGFVSSYAGLVVIRVLLGIFEGPMVSGVVLYLSGFYSRQELSLRIATFISAASLSGAFSGLFAAALVQLHGVGGRPGWAWIFIVEGILTILIGIFGFYIIPETPEDSRFLAAGLINFLPSIVNQLGFSPTTSQLLTVGPYAVACIVTLISAFLSDRHKIRSIPIIILSGIAAIGFAIYLTSHNRHLSYASLFFIVTGCFATNPMLSSWIANNSEPHYRRATTIALAQVLGVSGGILSIWRFPTRDGPRYTKIISPICHCLRIGS
ncbi:hypothetical protein CVT24_003587 [Panaeolus cyanescens]|uniref:Major facilitator superfamily (MFS) profile domain-containing protein n=1 Tax=Panaeolus cyanescens TaxID=181874 RepID=A0A409WMP9_9AGAR|nr:hypothetical protein CVT24_003587 [Panaeolus cyanescens]